MSRPIHIVAEASIPYLRGVLEELGEVTYLPSEQFSPDTIRNAEWLIVRSITKCGKSLLQGTKVRLITTATAGFEHIDAEYCTKEGITWYNAPGNNAESVGQYYGSAVSRWALSQGISLRGKTVGVVGVGHVGSVVKRYSEALGMKVLQNDPPRAEIEGESTFVSLDEIAREADIITFHTPLTMEGHHATYHLCDWDLVQKLQKKPLLINASRGAVVDSDAIEKGLAEGLISDLILDCWEGEPMISKALLGKTFLGTPHIAGFSADGKANGSRACIEHGCSFFCLNSTNIHFMTPPPPENPLIRLEDFPTEQRLLHLLLHTFDPIIPDQLLRQKTEEFAQLRKDYDYPREPHAYCVTGEYAPREREALMKIGFATE